MASILKVDDLRGNTAAGNITITSEGGSATMQLQQGVAKAWANFTTVTSTAIADSFNVGSLTDSGTAYTTVTFTNAMSNQDYSKSLSAGTGSYAMYAGTVSHGSSTTTEFRHYTADGATPTARDCDDNSATVHGDLA